MIEIRYIIETGQITGMWSGSKLGKQDIKLENKPNQAIVALDIPTPEKPSAAYLHDEATLSLIPNPDYVEPEPVEDLATRVSNLETKVEKIEKE